LDLAWTQSDREPYSIENIRAGEGNAFQRHPLIENWEEQTLAIEKEFKEFFSVDMNEGWECPEGYPEGIDQKILAGHLDDDAKTGNRTRLLRFQPGVFTTLPFVHEHWEEVYLVSGDLIVGNDENGEGGEQFQPNTYACRPPGAYHGPFKSEGGCLLFEIHYYDKG
jgi:hypothetical protein